MGLYVFIHEVSVESKQTTFGGSSTRSYPNSCTRGMNKERVNDACHCEKGEKCSETESTFELLQSRKRTASACSHCADSLPYISQGLKRHLEISSSNIRPPSAHGKRPHKRTTRCTSVWFGHSLFHSCRPHFMCHCFAHLISVLAGCSA